MSTARQLGVLRSEVLWQEQRGRGFRATGREDAGILFKAGAAPREVALNRRAAATVINEKNTVLLPLRKAIMVLVTGYKLS